MSRPIKAGPAEDYEALARAARPFVEEVSPDEAQRLLAQERALWVDVREPLELQALEPPSGALNLPLAGLPASALAAVPDRARPLIVACSSGQRSALAALRLEQAGYQRVLSLRGGWRAWWLRD